MTAADQLRVNLKALDGEIAAAKAEMKPIQQKVSRLEIERQELLRQIEVASKEPRVSDHAVIRYLERKYGFSFDAVRAEILTPDRAAAIRAGCVSISHEGVSFMVRDRTITTVVGGNGSIAA